uniref:Uncharacterized protein n=1 Tax=Hyaloperonospora arabidopsidis (strain Emoy2) TaxID=559515 RepID=M4B427_HYAAE
MASHNLKTSKQFSQLDALPHPKRPTTLTRVHADVGTALSRRSKALFTMLSRLLQRHREVVKCRSRSGRMDLSWLRCTR